VVNKNTAVPVRFRRNSGVSAAEAARTRNGADFLRKIPQIWENNA